MKRRRETAFDIAVDISLDATVDHFRGLWLRLVLVWLCNDSKDYPGQPMGQGGWGDRETTGNPKSSGPQVRWAWLNVLRSAQ
jgi:hypothetical protein